MKSKFGHSAPPQPSAQSVGGGATSQTAADFVVRFGEVRNSSLSDQSNTVEYSITGIVGFTGDTENEGQLAFEDDTLAEGTNDAAIYTSPGIIGRPLPPRVVAGEELHMDVICVIAADGLVPIAYRDTRLAMAGDAAPGEGVLAFVGYGGGFHSMTPVGVGANPAGGGTIHVIYCPYDFNASGIAQKAHSIILDPTPGNESIIIAHADAQAITMANGEIVLKSPDGTAFIAIKNGTIDFVALTCTFNSGVVIGDSAAAAALVPASVSTKLFISP